MPRHGFASIALLAAVLLAGCGGTTDFGYSQPRAISADIDASLSHGPTSTDLMSGMRFNDALDAAAARGPTQPGLAFAPR
ncbi:MAG TPA: hypothetical protein VN802_16600 [Stellaceae bacterium]|nr:hypothetical protein [Stellaceae bacterium]